METRLQAKSVAHVVDQYTRLTAGEGAGIFPSHALSRPRNAGRRLHEQEVRALSSRLVALITLILPLALATGTAAPAGPKKPLTYAAYDGWRSIQGTQIARDGSWLVYALVPQDGDSELVVRNLKTDKEYRAARGKDPVLTMDGKFVVFTIAPPKAEMDKAKKEKKESRGPAQRRPGHHESGHRRSRDRRKGQELQAGRGIRRFRGLSPRAAGEEGRRQEG